MNANKVPEDSTLKRHYESQMKMNKAGGQSTSTSRGASSRASPSSSGSGSSSSGGGFFGWLKGLFGS